MKKKDLSGAINHMKWSLEMGRAMGDVIKERERQLKKWGKQCHDLSIFLNILMEEVGELSKEVLTDKFKQPQLMAPNLYVEATQVAAVALAIMQRIRTGSA